MTTIEGAEMDDADMQKVTETLQQHRAEHWTHDLWTCACEPDFWRRHVERQGHLAQAVLAALDLSARDARIRAEALREAANEIALPGILTRSGYFGTERAHGYRQAEREASDWLHGRAAAIEGAARPVRQRSRQGRWRDAHCARYHE